MRAILLSLFSWTYETTHRQTIVRQPFWMWVGGQGLDMCRCAWENVALSYKRCILLGARSLAASWSSSKLSYWSAWKWPSWTRFFSRFHVVRAFLRQIRLTLLPMVCDRGLLPKNKEKNWKTWFLKLLTKTTCHKYKGILVFPFPSRRKLACRLLFYLVLQKAVLPPHPWPAEQSFCFQCGSALLLLSCCLLSAGHSSVMSNLTSCAPKRLYQHGKGNLEAEHTCAFLFQCDQSVGLAQELRRLPSGPAACQVFLLPWNQHSQAW